MPDNSKNKIKFTPKQLLLFLVIALSLRVFQETLNVFFGWRDWYYIFDFLFLASMSLVIIALLRNIYFYSNELAEKETSLNIIVENMKAGIIVMDPAGNITYMNGKLTESWKISKGTFPIPTEEWIEKITLYHTDGTLMQKNEIPFVQLWNGEEVTNLEYILKQEGKSPQHLLANGTRLLDKNGGFSGAILVLNDITDLKQAELTIKHMAYHDPVTDLPNLYSFNESLSEKINPANHNSQEHFLMFLDLDGFKLVNDTIGHQMGDYLLR